MIADSREVPLVVVSEYPNLTALVFAKGDCSTIRSSATSSGRRYFIAMENLSGAPSIKGGLGNWHVTQSALPSEVNISGLSPDVSRVSAAEQSFFSISRRPVSR